MGSLELNAIVLKLQKENRVTDLKKCGTKICNLHDPKIFRVDALYLASSEGVHMRANYFYYFLTHSETSGIFGSDHGMTIGFEPGEMIVVKKSCQSTYFQVRTKKPRELVCEK